MKYEQIKIELSPFWLWIQKAKPYENKLNSTVYIGKRSADKQLNVRLKDIDNGVDVDGDGDFALKAWRIKLSK